MVDGRRDIVSDPYFDLGLTAGWIGLLDIGVRRGRDYERLSERLGRVEAKVIDTFWLIRGVRVQMPLAGVERLAEDEEVLYIEPDDTDDAAANGNNGPAGSTVNVPANAHKAIGVGNVDVQSGAQVTTQSRGPAPDGRFKPDIQAPTNTETASNASDTARRVFGGTSGATPYAAGAAALLRNWLRRSTGSIDPGQVNAQMILAGQHPYPFTNIEGAGPIELPTNGFAWWGKVTVGDGENVDIPIAVNAESANTLDAALWWPEGGVRVFGFQIDWHSDIDLHLIDPSGSTRASSVSIPSVFERARSTVVSPTASGSCGSGASGFRSWRLPCTGRRTFAPGEQPPADP